MKAAQLFVTMILLASCRSTRSTIDIMDAKSRQTPTDGDYLHVPGSVQTTVKISALSLPPEPSRYERLELTVRKAGTTEDRFRNLDYKIGDLIPIDAHLRYDIIVSAWMGAAEVYSTRYCVQRQGFLAEEGVNIFTAALCAKP